jgi:hypothetical protein
VLIHDPPKGSHCLLFSVEEVLEKPTTIEWQWIRVALAILSKFRDPIIRLAWINDLEEASGIEIRAALIV